MRIGEPSDLFSNTWTITRWVECDPADHAPVTCADAAETLARFRKALHQRAPEEGPSQPDARHPAGQDAVR